MIVLPELCFSGATFFTKSDIFPYTFESTKGTVYEWAVSQAQRLKSVILLGYAERAGIDFFNSMLIVSEKGELIKNYRKALTSYYEWVWAWDGIEGY